MGGDPGKAAVGAATINVPYLLLCGFIIAVALTCLPAFFLTWDWVYIVVVIAAFIAGGLLLFDRRTGADSA